MPASIFLRSLTQSVAVPLTFLSDPGFIRLQVLSGEPGPIVMGRLLALSVCLAHQESERLFFSEVDEVVAWQGRWRGGEEAWGMYLVAIGWAREEGFRLRIMLPKEVKVKVRSRTGGKVRVDGAPREANGRLLPTRDPDSKKAQQAEARVVVKLRKRTAMDADGNLIGGGDE